MKSTYLIIPFSRKGVKANRFSFFADLDRVLKTEYRPSVPDVLHARSSTTGVHEISFGFKNFNIRQDLRL